MDKISQHEVHVDFASRYEDLKLLPRRWFPLWRLDGYILREFLIKYSILLLVFVILFLLSDVYRDIARFLDAHAPAKTILAYLFYKQPGNIRFVLPISMLLGCIWTMATFGKNMEVTAMRASGVSLFRCGGPIIVMGFLVSLVNVYFNEALVPWATREADRLYSAGADHRAYSQALLSYRSDDGERRWLFQLFEGGRKYQNVTMKTFWTKPMVKKIFGAPGSDRNENSIRALCGQRAEVFLAMPPDVRQKELEKFFLGRKVDFTINEAEYDGEERSWKFSSGTFVSYDRNEETRFSASNGTSFLHAPREFHDMVLTRQEAPEDPSDIANAIKEKDDLSTPVIWGILHRNKNLPEKARAVYWTVFFYRIAFPWASFLAVFLGIPLATKNERTGSLLAIVSAIGLIVVYIVVAQLFLMFGKAGLVNPVFAGLAPTIGFIAAGAWRLVTDRN